MNDTQAPLSIQRALERIRQERETFEQKKKHENRWFLLRLTMGFSSILLLSAVMVLCSVILLNPSVYSAGVVASAGVALFTDVLGLLIGVWKIVISPSSITQLEPVTNLDPALFSSVAAEREKITAPPSREVSKN
jgi:uncharacterized membrane protein YqjE